MSYTLYNDTCNNCAPVLPRPYTGTISHNMVEVFHNAVPFIILSIIGK